MGSDFYLLFISHLTQAPFYQVPGPLPDQLSGRVLGQNAPLVLLPLCSPTSSLELSPPKIGGLGPDSSKNHPSHSPGLCIHMRMVQMTSSLQRQEVRIPAILSPSSSTVSSAPSSGGFLPHPTGSRPPPSLYSADPHLSGGCPS